MAFVSFTQAVAGQVATAVFYNNNLNAISTQFNGNVDDTNLAALSVGTSAIKTGAVTGVKIAMGSDAQGDILFRGASNYQRLAAGTSGQVLITKGAASNPVFGYTGALQTVNNSSGAVATGTTVIPIDDTIPQNTEGDQYLTVSITPKSASSKLCISGVLQISNNNGSPYLIAALFQDALTNALNASMELPGAQSQVPTALAFQHYMTSGGTSAIAFKVRAGADSAGTTTINGFNAARKLGGVLTSSITVKEIL